MARTEMPSSIEELQVLVAAQQRELDTKQSTIEAKQVTIDAKQATIETQAERITLLEEWKRLITTQRFAPKSEKHVPEQGRLFNEAEVEANASADDDPAATIEVPAHARRRRGRRPLPDFLPVREILHDLPEEEKVCDHDPAHTLVEISRENSDQLTFIPATVEILRHVRPKYACPSCKQGVKIAPMPHLPIPKSLATPSLLAHIATSKYVDALPLYRQEKIFHRLGLDLSRATLASWMIKVGDLVEPLLDRLRSKVRGGSFVQCDETPFQVLKEPGKRAQSQSYLWVLRGGTPGHPLLLYEYDPSRSAEAPKRLLLGF
jgi:transposase